MRFRKVLPTSVLIVTALLITVLGGCDSLENVADSILNKTDQQEQSEETGHENPANLEGTGVPVTDHFNGMTPNIYRQIVSSRIICQSGNCPEKTSLNDYVIDENWLDLNNYSEMIDDTILLHIGSTNYADSVGSCTEKESFSYPGTLTITSITDDTIIAEGKGMGYHEVIGTGCSEGESKYQYETTEQWIFTTKNLAQEVIVEAFTSTGNELIVAPGWNNPQSNPQYSETSLIIRCTDTKGFKVKPGIEVVKINGYDTEASAIQGHYEQISETEAWITFASYYNADYTIQAYCWVYGKNGSVLGKVYATGHINPNEDAPPQVFFVKVTDSPQGALPESMYR